MAVARFPGHAVAVGALNMLLALSSVVAGLIEYLRLSRSGPLGGWGLFSCKRRGFCPSCGARRMAQTAVHLVERVISHVPVRQWVLSLPIPPSSGTVSPLD